MCLETTELFPYPDSAACHRAIKIIASWCAQYHPIEGVSCELSKQPASIFKPYFPF